MPDICATSSGVGSVRLLQARSNLAVNRLESETEKFFVSPTNV
jgi:hypothetical protein